MLSVEYNFLFIFFIPFYVLSVSSLIIIILDHLSCAWMNLSGKVKFISSLLLPSFLHRTLFQDVKNPSFFEFKSSVSCVSCVETEPS